jgi:hypothetical protein
MDAGCVLVFSPLTYKLVSEPTVFVKINILQFFSYYIILGILHLDLTDVTAEGSYSRKTARPAAVFPTPLASHAWWCAIGYRCVAHPLSLSTQFLFSAYSGRDPALRTMAVISGPAHLARAVHVPRFLLCLGGFLLVSVFFSGFR